MQHFSKLIPELLVADLDVSRRFWCDLVGFSIGYERPEDRFMFLDLAGAQVMLEQIDPGATDWHTAPLEPPLGRGINLQIRVPSLPLVLARLQAAAWPLFIPPEDRWHRVGDEAVGQRRALVLDPDGYLLRLIEPLGTPSAQRLA